MSRKAETRLVVRAAASPSGHDGGEHGSEHGHDGDERGHGGGEHGILSGHDGTHGPGDSGEGIAAGASGDRALRGRGTEHGRSGEADGSAQAQSR